jgi:two-component system response regulator PilR (NtrC family)
MSDFLGVSPAVVQLRHDIDRVAQASASVLIQGETGVGKDVVAHALHEQSGRSRLVVVDCGTLTDELAASDLFGYRRGAFTGATEPSQGLLATADKGTLFLDEIGNLSARGQSMLLRALQTRRVRRVGDTEERSIDVRVIAATNSRLSGFRPDLLYRLSTITLTVPPLRSRREDIPIVAEHTLTRLNREYGRMVRISNGAIRVLQG